jgi:inhibitor of cysteine peptidase
VELEQAGAAGYVWEIQDPDATHFEVVSMRTEPADKPGLVGGPVKKVWLIRVKEKGKADLQFFHYRPWEGKEKAVNTFWLKVRIL